MPWFGAQSMGGHSGKQIGDTIWRAVKRDVREIAVAEGQVRAREIGYALRGKKPYKTLWVAPRATIKNPRRPQGRKSSKSAWRATLRKRSMGEWSGITKLAINVTNEQKHPYVLERRTGSDYHLAAKKTILNNNERISNVVAKEAMRRVQANRTRARHAKAKAMQHKGMTTTVSVKVQ